MAAATATTEATESICAGRSRRLQLGFLDFRGAPIGVDVRYAVELEVTPAINTGILHEREPIGQVGAGVAHAPLDCFRQALLALDELLGPSPLTGEGRGGGALGSDPARAQGGET